MQNKKYTVTISEKAASMLVTHIKYFAAVSPEAEKKLHKEIIKEATALEFMPESYPRLCVSEIPPNKYRKKLVAKRYFLIYQIKDLNVYIDYISDCRQDYKWLL